MALDPSISLQVQQQNPMATLGSLLDVSNKAQQFTGQKIQNESNQRTLTEQNNIRQLMQNPKQFMDEAGNFDWNKFTPAILQAAPTVGPEFIPKIYQGVTAHSEATKSIQSMNQDQLKGVLEFANANKTDAPAMLAQKMAIFGQANPALAGMASAAQRLIKLAGDDPKAQSMAIGQLFKGVQNAAEQRSMGKPEYVQAGTEQVNINPQAEAPMLPGAVSPAQQVFNPQTKAPEMLGSTSPMPGANLTGEIPGDKDMGFVGDPKKAAQDIIDSGASPEEKRAAIEQLNRQVQGQKRNMQTGPALGQEALVGGTAANINKDWTDTQDAAKTAQTDIGLLQNIKKYADGAVTGVETDRRAYLAGLAGLLHMSSAELAKTNTDLLAKNTNMLALAGGDTNLARTMAEGANPNTHMTPEAIKDAADQIMAQRKLAIEKQKLFGPLKSMVDRQLVGPEVYNQALSNFNQMADPRILQLEDMSKEQKAKMMNAMSPSEQTSFIKKVRAMHQFRIGQ